MLRLLSLVAAVLLALFVTYASASAQAAEGKQVSDRDAEARGLFLAGKAAYDQGRYEDALGYFYRAYQLSNRPELLYNIGQASDRLRKDREALGAFTEYLNLVPDSPNRATVEGRIRLLRQVIDERERERQAAQTGPATSAGETKATAGKGPEPAEYTGEPAPAPAQPEVVSNQDYTSGSSEPVDREGGSIWSKWWLWTAVGAAVAAGVVIGVVAASSKDTRDPPDKVGTGVVVTTLRLP